MDLEFMILDTFDALRPRRAPKFASLEEATVACNNIVVAETDFSRDVDFQCPEAVSEAARDYESVALIIQQYFAPGGNETAK